MTDARAAGVVLAMAAASGCVSRPKSAADIDAPAYTWSFEHGFCGEQHALDANGGVWFERGCEGHTTGFKKLRTAPPAEAAKIRAAFEALRGGDTTECGEGTFLHRFELRKGDHVHVHRVCVPATDDNLPDPFDAIPRVFTDK